MIRTVFFVFLLQLLFILPSMAQNVAGPRTVNNAVMAHAQNIGRSCPGQWEKQVCLKAVSESVLDMASSYAEALDKEGNEDEIESLKQHCAAATAASKDEFPAYAMKSAYIECANTIQVLATKTGIAPDPSHFQLLVVPILCLSKDPSCLALDAQMQQYAR